MKPLIDCDVLLYEIGYCGEYKDEDTGELLVRPFDVVSEAFDQRVKEICAEVWATEEPIFFITNNKRIYERQERAKARLCKRMEARLKNDPSDKLSTSILKANQPAKYNPNFRDKVAKAKVYKGNRKDNKPLHWENLLVYVMAKYDYRIAEGMEADDLMCIYQMSAEPLSTIICTRDKDLRICPGMHYGWPCGRQEAFGPCQVTELGTLELLWGKKLVGTGLMFFYSQMLTGDNTDNIPGLPRCGPVKAFKLLEQCTGEAELFEVVKEAYKSSYGDAWHTEMNEQAQLLWMVQELTEDGLPVHWVMYEDRKI